MRGISGMLGQIWLVALGGFFGAITRYSVNRYFSRVRLFPFGTFLVNMTGSFLMGLLSGSKWISDSMHILVGTGFLGAYTTFSTFNFELLMLRRNQRTFQFYLYAISSYCLGIIFAFLGYLVTSE